MHALGRTSADADPAYHRTLHIIFSAAPHDELAGAALDRATDWHRPVVHRFADRFVELSSEPAAEPAAVADTQRFFFGWEAAELAGRHQTPGIAALPP